MLIGLARLSDKRALVTELVKNCQNIPLELGPSHRKYMNALSLAKQRALLSGYLGSLPIFTHVCRAGVTFYWRKESQGLSSMDSAEDYSKWSSDQLVGRVVFLERQLREQTAR